MRRTVVRPLSVLLSLLALLSLEGAASAGIGDLKGTKPGDLAFPQFENADACALCHGGGVMGDTSFLPSDTWAGTMMANAARDPVFFAALTIANQDAPGVGTYCLRCHSPIGFVQGHATPPDGSAFDDVDRQGVGCETCHRANQSPPPDAPYLLSDAQLVYTEDTRKHGPYPGSESTSPSHGNGIQDPGLADSRFCGQCHQVTNPEAHLRDSMGVDTGLEFPLDTTYEEWSLSDYAKPGSASAASCADCHMPRKLGQHPVTKLEGSPLRPDPREHAFVGGNVWGIQAVMAANPERAAAFPKAFQLALNRTQESLARAVKVTIVDAPQTVAPGASFMVKVRVENLTGHKFPTGYAESRRAWIGVSLLDADQQETVLLGGYDLESGHIQAEPPTRVYRAQHGSWDGAAAQPEEHLARHDMILSDTRIPPRGFSATLVTLPSGEIDFNDGNGGYRSFDEATFTLGAPAGFAGSATLSAQVYYQSMTPEHIEFLKSENTTDSRGADLQAIFQATGRGAPIPIATAKTIMSFSVTSGAGGAGGSAGSTASTGAAGAPATTGGSGGSGGSKDPDGGCGCRVAGAPPEAVASGLSLGLLFAAVLRPKRRCRRRSVAS